MLIELSQRNPKRSQNLPEVAMTKVYDDLNSIMVRINAEGFSSDLIKPLDDVLSQLKKVDELIDQADELAQRFLASECEGKRLLAKQKEIWKSKSYSDVFKPVWNDIQDIVKTCRMIKGPLSNQKDNFSKYIKSYLSSMNDFAERELSESDYKDFISKINKKCDDGIKTKGDYVI